MAILVAQADRQAVHLRFGGKTQSAAAQTLIDAAYEVGDFLIAEGIGQRQHRHRMGDFSEASRRAGAHLLGRAVGTGKIRMLALQRLQLTHQTVVVDVGDLRRIQLVIGAIGLGDLPAQVFSTFGGAGAHRNPRVLGWP
ncbi:hypothetical protein D3C73_1105420 [compost metagenome]